MAGVERTREDCYGAARSGTARRGRHGRLVMELHGMTRHGQAAEARKVWAGEARKGAAMQGRQTSNGRHMTTALSLIEQSDERLIPILSASLYPGAAPSSIALALNYCRAAQLDPLQKPVHIVPMWDSKAGAMRDVIMPGIGLYRTQAARSGKCAGISEPEFGPVVETTIGGAQVAYPEWCRVTVKRALDNGSIAEFTAREFWIENYAVKGGKEKSVAPNAMWTKRGYGQLAKCAEAQALRKAFPELIGAAPTAEEMIGKAVDVETIEGTTRELAPPDPWTDETRASAMAASQKGMTAYTQWWKDQPQEFREAAVSTSTHADMKTVAGESGE